ncbi:MAG: hypothetical protein H6797_03705 [Candidatus Nomurabacteria bacterium]|nr:MAG: hypothetical protein H6797_03705 [Candidatus Nomurabacteria bacterium]
MSVEKYPRPTFTEDDLPLNDQQLSERETWMMEVGNWREDHSIPSVGEHYRYMWKWDSLKAAVINARRNDPSRAATELITLERYRDTLTGFMPNKIFATAKHKTWRDYPEAWNFNNNKIGTSYSQPPIEAWAAIETYKSFVRVDQKDNGLKFLQSIYGYIDENNHTGLQGEHAYFIDHRQNSSNDRLIGIVHPNETGRDSDEANKPWLTRNKNLGKSALHEWLHMQKLGWDLGRLGRDPRKHRVDWIPKQVRQKYWVNDVMFNAMHANNMRYLADIADILSVHQPTKWSREQYALDSEKYRLIANEVEHEILNRMWDDRKEFFYNLDENGNQIHVPSITGLFPLLLENISDDHIAALLDKLEDSEWFASPYPIPTHAVCSEFYDPDPEKFKGTFTPQWSGPVWLDTNHLIVEEGLVPRIEILADPGRTHASHLLAKRALETAGIIKNKTKELLANNLKSMEYYSSVTGKGQRVTDFMWSNIGLHFEKYDAINEEPEET